MNFLVLGLPIILANNMFDNGKNVTLVDALDKVIEKGAVVNGEVVISIANVDLVFIGLRLILTSVSKVEEMKDGSNSFLTETPTPEELEYIHKLQKEIRKSEENINRILDTNNPKETEKGIAKLILTLVELIRRLMEKEAYRRVKKGSLSSAEIQKLGLSLKAVEKKIKEVQIIFGLENDDLNLDLGPLGNLM